MEGSIMLDTTTGAGLWQWLEGRDTARMNRYRKYLAFYEGEQWDERRRAGERRLTVNYARALVRKSASYLMPRPVTFDVREEGKTGSGDSGVGSRRTGPLFHPPSNSREGPGEGAIPPPSPKRP
jgi:hypothetical protein